MYDYLENHKIKCFYTPSYFNNKIILTCKKARHFKIGDKVPIKTSYYKYSKNLLIIDDTNNNLKFHFIDNGIFIKTLSIELLNNEDFKNIQETIDCYGTPLNIKSVKNIRTYINEKNKRNEILKNLNKNLNIIIDLYSVPLTHINNYLNNYLYYPKKECIINIFNNITKIDKYLNENDNILISKELLNLNNNLMSITEFKDYLFKSNMEEFHNFIFKLKSILKIHLKQSQELINLEHKKNDSEIDTILKDFSDKWNLENKYSTEMKLGQLLYCFKHFSCKNEIIKQVKILLQTNPMILNTYSEWNDTSLEQLKKDYSFL